MLINFRISTGNRIFLKVTDFKKLKNKIELSETKNLKWIDLTIDSTKLKTNKLKNRLEIIHNVAEKSKLCKNKRGIIL